MALRITLALNFSCLMLEDDVGIMIHMLYLMATHSSQMINYSAAKFTHFHEDKSFFHVETSSHTFTQRKVYFM